MAKLAAVRLTAPPKNIEASTHCKRRSEKFSTRTPTCGNNWEDTASYSKARPIRSSSGMNPSLCSVNGRCRRPSLFKTATLHKAILRASSLSGGGGGRPGVVMPPAAVLVGSRTDQYREREVSIQEGQELARDLGIEHLECSAARQESHAVVAEVFRTVVRMMQQQREQEILQDWF
ncbi:hypothetical protein B0I37DRAFT_42262 [Chaetomium sp. MPI-CAGE-AT-0009]|nr:hypothetical protein B0I37DRAFT_42262 [Chaetomium sp. MPI-CAGE-AT-0009]